VGFEDFQTRLRRSTILEDDPLLFHLAQKRNVRADGIVLALDEIGSKRCGQQR
jgi:hypothetical protein